MASAGLFLKDYFLVDDRSAIFIEIILNIFFRVLKAVTYKIFIIEFISFWKA